MTSDNDKKPPTLNRVLEEARRNIEVEDDELDEARDRRDKLRSVLAKEFAESTTYVNGSVAHGDALTPLTDVDVGVIVAEAIDTHGPGKEGPRGLMDRAANRIREELKDDYKRLSVTVEGQKRSVLVRFGDPVTPGQRDFTADVIVAIENCSGAGLFIPNEDSWDRSHPVGHTGMVRTANKDKTGYTYAKVVRLLKHWNRSNGKPLCSWNIKALALGCITGRVTMVEGLQTWFAYAHAELGKGETPDPAGVAPEPIHINEAMTMSQVRDKLAKASRQLAQAIEYDVAGYPALAQNELAQMFNDKDMLPPPDETALLGESRRYDNHRRPQAPAVIASRPAAPSVRPWAP
ncbi:nucleotidyltransferase [uncultured Nocardioides sp.]|uniref:nucleotidyltransferase domain-containing protein n=1 Tax=uncultured Nocardioides sp. TaxID=198441 RepID=UPI00260957EA|nr:nucleotidyltransferase [uncultured Nocardioides sp.]